MTSQLMGFTKQTATVIDVKKAIKNCKRAGNFRFAESLKEATQMAKKHNVIITGLYNNCAFIVNYYKESKQADVALMRMSGDIDDYSNIHLQHMLRVRPREIFLDVLRLTNSDNEHAMLSYEYELDAKCSMVLDTIFDGEIRE